MSVREIFARYGQEYLDAYGRKVPIRHRKVLHSILNCRTPALGAVLCSCESCGTTYTIYRSCGDRHCPTCQGEKANASGLRQSRCSGLFRRESARDRGKPRDTG